MKTIAALPLLALTLAACETYPGDPAYPGGPDSYPPQMPYPPQGPYPPQPYPPYPPQGPGAYESYRAMGTEPGWSLTIDDREMRFDGDYGQFSIVQPKPVPINGTAGPIYRTQRLEVNITHTPCNDGMSDRRYPDSVQVYADGRLYRGCGAPQSFYAGGENAGQPGYPTPLPSQPPAMLSGTNWRVVSINGRPTPQRDYYVNFMPDGRMNAKLGCNTLGAGYSMQGEFLNAGAIMATRMACPDMNFETLGSNVLSQPMRVAMMGDRMTLSNAAGSIELVRNR